MGFYVNRAQVGLILHIEKMIGAGILTNAVLEVFLKRKWTLDYLQQAITRNQ